MKKIRLDNKLKSVRLSLRVNLLLIIFSNIELRKSSALELETRKEIFFLETFERPGTKKEMSCLSWSNLSVSYSGLRQGEL